MSLRGSIKQWCRQTKDDTKAFFNRKDGDRGTTRPITPLSTIPRTSSTALAECVDNQGASISRISTPTQATASPQVAPQINDASYVESSLGESPEARPGMAGMTPSSHGISFRVVDTSGEISSGSVIPPSQATERTTAMLPSQVQTGKRLKVAATGFLGLAMDGLKFGPIREIINLLERIADDYIMDGKVKQEFDSLVEELRAMLKTFEDHLGENVSPTVESELQDMRRFFEEKLSHLVGEQKGMQGRRYRLAEDNEARFLACRSQVQTYMGKLLIGTRIEVIQMREEQSKSHIKARLDRLPSSPSAWYNSSAGADLKRRECTPGTRAKVLANILDWTSDNTIGGVYWLNGMAGTGKTTIAYSVCKELAKRRQLAASFFCSRLREECRNVNMIIPSIAYQLAQFSPEFRFELATILEEDQDLHHKVLDEQFESLVRIPLMGILDAKPLNCGQMIVMIDALDECESKETTRTLLHLLLSITPALPIKFILSSRPEPQLRDQLTEGRVGSTLVLHELDTGEVRADIATYLREELEPMKLSQEELDTWIGLLVEKAGILFIYAATAVRYIGFDHFQRNPVSRLRSLLGGPQSRKTTSIKEIDVLYTTILEAAVSEEGLEEENVADMRQVLHTVICAREPLTVKGLSELLQIDDLNRVRGALRPLWSVLHVVGESEVVTTLHASFPDFMFDSARSGTYHCDYKAYNHELAGHCFERIKRTDRQFNICGLESSYLLDRNVPNIEHRVTNAIPSGLLYACRYWADHLKEGDCASRMSEQLRDLLSARLLLWMEVLNLSKQATVAGECMKPAVGWCRELQGEQELVELAEDARRFVDMFISNPVSQSTPHVYVSMLAFWPKSAPIARQYSKFTQSPVQAEGTALDRRQLAHLATWKFNKFIWSMSISPGGSYIALGLDDVVVVLNSSNREVVTGPLAGHSKMVRAIAFSPDGARIVSGGFGYDAHSATIIGWDVQKGDTVLGPFELDGHTDDITCITFSLDCTCVATGSDDNSIRVWDVNTGSSQYSLQAQGAIYGLAFSPDGTLIAAQLAKTFQVWSTQTKSTTGIAAPTHAEDVYGTTFFSNSRHIIYSTDDDYAIYVWDVQTGDMVLGPIPGHTARVDCIGCSPDGRYIVSGSWDRTVRVWNAQNGNLLLGPLKAHADDITSFAFSPDSSRIISACKGKYVCTWDALQRNHAPTPTQSPSRSGYIACVKFSSDGTRFISGSKEGTMSIWDTHTGEMIVGPIKTHFHQIRAVDCLDDRVVSGSDDETICVCDVWTGEVVLGPLELGLGKIHSVAYSPDGKLIATGSYERVDVWNAGDSSRVLGPLTGLRGIVFSLQFSPDSTRIVAGSGGVSSNTAIWDVSDGANVFDTLNGHTSSVASISYSPNGALIASGSNDKVIIIWNTYTGKMALGPLTGHSNKVSSVHFSPDSTRLVSGSYDRTIRIWDVQTGEMMFELLNEHKDTITSVAYSPDGTRILSLSNNGSVCIHDARSPKERFRSTSGIGDWKMNKDGWVMDDQSRLLAWVPGDLRPALMPPTQLIEVPSPFLRLQFDGSRMGESWEKVDTSRM